jgi:LPS export ABC transporter protein LptC
MITKTRRKRTRNILTLAISIVIITYYVIGISQNQFLPIGKKALDNQSASPDSSSTGVVIKRFDSMGQLHYTMSSNQADFFSAKTMGLPISMQKTDNTVTDDTLDTDNKEPLNNLKDERNEKRDQQDYLRMLDPKITAYENGKPSKFIAANLAYLTNNGDTAELIGNVLVNDSAAAVQLQTQSLTLNSTLQQILTQSPVVIKTPISTTHATGLQGNLIDQRWHLLSKVKTEVKNIAQP